MNLASNNVNNIPIYTPASPKGIDVIINALQQKFSAITWNSKSFGRAFEIRNKNKEGDEYIFPAVMTGSGKELEDVLALDTVDGYSFLIPRGEETPFDDDELGLNINNERFQRELHAIFWMNLDSTNTTIEDRKDEIQQAIKDVRFSNSACELVISSITDEPEEVFDGFSLQASESQNLYPPFWGVRVTMIAYYYHPCDDYTFGSTVLSSLTLTPSGSNEQSIATGAAIDTINGETDQDADFYLLGTANGLTLTKLTNRTFTISGTPTATVDNLTLVAIGKSGGIEVSQIEITITAATTISSITYANNSQTIWNESGSTGVFTNMTVTKDPTAATGTFAVTGGSLPAGLSLDSNTGEISVSAFSSVPVGANTFTIRFTANGVYTGTADFVVTITKRELATLDDITNSVYDWDFSEDGTITESDSIISQVNGRFDAVGYNATTTGAGNRQPYKGSLNGVRAAIWNEGGMGVALASDISMPYSVFIVGQFYHGITASYYGVDSENFVSIQANTGSYGRWYHEVNNANTTVTFDSLKERGDITAHPSIFQHTVGTTNSRIKYDDGETYDSGDYGTPDTTDLPTATTLGICFRGNSGNTGVSGVVGEFVLIPGTLSSADEDLVQGILAWKWGLQDYLPLAHTYKSSPPFKALS